MELCTEREIAKKFNLNKKTLQTWRHRGGGPPFMKLSRMVRYDPIAVEAWAKSRTVRSTSELPHGSE